MRYHTYIFISALLLLQGCFLSFQPSADLQSGWQKSVVEEPQYGEAAIGGEYGVSDKIVSFARAQLGTPYRYGGMNRGGFDCSGFVCYVYGHAVGKKLPRTAAAQSSYVRMYDLSQLEAGDLVFFDTSGRGSVNHCGIYLGNGKFIHASSGKAYCVTISDLTRGFYRRTFCWGGKVPVWQTK